LESCTHVICPNHLGKLLLGTGNVDIDSKDNYGQTPLLWAAESGHEAVVKLLLEMGKADVDCNCNGRTPLSYAAENGHEAVVKLLLETGRADVDSRDKYSWTPLSFATLHGHEAVVKLLQSPSLHRSATLLPD
jgi:ankyrin repeat protein